LKNTTPESLIPYDDIVQKALLTVVPGVLKDIVDAGGQMPGQHHLYVTFDTRAAGVEIPDGLRAKFPREMTIVLQHRFANLEVGEDAFSVNLAFSGVPTTLIIPYHSITNFIDPHVDFGLKFVAGGGDASEEQDSENGSDDTSGNVIPVDFGRR
jgi:hypothetical protein